MTKFSDFPKRICLPNSGYVIQPHSQYVIFFFKSEPKGLTLKRHNSDGVIVMPKVKILYVRPDSHAAMMSMTNGSNILTASQLQQMLNKPE